MSYKALYRTYRPQTFNDVTGQDVVVQTLQNAIKNNKISHAYLFCGPRGTGKTSIARIFAKALNCSNINNGEPCDDCISCKEISQGINPDVIEIDAASNNGVDEIRDIREKVKYLPSGSKYKIYIIDEVHMLSGGAFNALLKTLEEPPKHVVFILATTEPQKLPATIVSRCQRYEFKSLSVAEISERLKAICELENVSISEEALNSISESAEGAMRDALSILDQAISYGNKNIEIDDINGVTGTLSFEKVINLSNAIENKDIHRTLEVVHDLLSNGKEINKIINGLLVFYRDVLLYKSVGDSGYSKYIFEKEEFKIFSDNVNTNKIMYLIDILCDIQGKVKFSTTPNIFLEIALIKMCNVNNDDLDILKRLTELENKINNIGDFEVSSSNVTVDNEKVNMLETRISQIVNELNRLELRKQIEKIDELKIIVNNISNSTVGGTVDREIQSELNHLKDKIDELDLFVNKEETKSNDDLLEKINELEAKITNNSTGIDSNILNKVNDFEEKLNCLTSNNNNYNNNEKDYNELLNKINSLQNQINNSIFINNDSANECNVDLNPIYVRLNALENKENASVDLSGIYSRITALEIREVNENPGFDNDDKLNNIYEELSVLKDDIYQIKNQLIENKNVNYDISNITEISEKVMFLEKRMYQIIAGELSNKKPHKKEPKKNSGQIMLFGDEILGIADLEENKKEKVDFEQLSRTEPLIEKTEVKDQEYLAEEFEQSDIIEETIERYEQEEIKQDSEEEINQDMDQQEDVEIEEIDYEESHNEYNGGLFETDNLVVNVSKEVEVSPVESKYFDVNEVNKVSKEEDGVQKIVVGNTQIINSEHSSLVITPKEDDSNYKLEQNLINNEYKTNKKEEIVNEEVVDDGKDKFASYNIKHIEQILHDSRSIEARNDKVRMEQAWKNMTRGARPEQLSIIETLQSGMVAVVGNKEFIISFPNVNLCNMVMRGKFKEVAVRVLYNLLGETYNYIALPNDAWSKISAEYKGQYQMGTKYPTLKPLSIPGLEVIEDEYETVSEKAINRTLRMFGQNNVKIE